ncbi:alpha/beta hydrolase [Pseudomonas sp. dw_358]|uniref:alpha/beta fold hydrolase n=1 Tax=Pseudomonas sp. dw_358 TaxID=2720083 RepID=UPI001BD438CD|nr:alpha/beta hydrolase [Pseudomonas sp. dw_358]
MTLAAIPLSVWRTRSQAFAFQGHQIRYWTAGQGEPLLLLHGFATGSWDWHYLWQPLAKRYRLISCDMLGFGDSAKPTRHRYSLAGQADLQLALLEHLGVNRTVHLLGHDYGANVAQELIARHHEGRARVASCLFIGAGLFAEATRRLPVQKVLLSPLGPLAARLFSRQTLVRHVLSLHGTTRRPSESDLDDHWSLMAGGHGTRVLHRLVGYVPERARYRARWVQAMQQAQVPMRLIAGALDPLAGPRMVERFRQLMVPADTVLLPETGHYPHTEVPEQVLEHYLMFRGQQVALSRHLAASWAATARLDAPQP